MSKVDFKKELKELYKPGSKEFAVVDVPKMNFLQISGKGDPNSEPFYKEALEALYAVSYKVKFFSKKELERDYVVPPLEGLWWADDPKDFANGKKENWFWTMMIMVPSWIDQKMIDEAIEVVKKKKDLPALSLLELKEYHEGESIQILHIGSYEDEAPTLKELHESYIPKNGYCENGKHHEIYLSDPRKVAPEKLKTILRQPVKKL